MVSVVVSLLLLAAWAAPGDAAAARGLLQGAGNRSDMARLECQQSLKGVNNNDMLHNFVLFAYFYFLCWLLCELTREVRE